MSIFQLFYVSEAAEPHDRDAVREILQASRRNNWRLDITGCLLVSGRYYGQVLEGSKPAVAALAARISTDPRHGRVRVLSETESSTRRYNDWSMAHMYDLSLEDELAALLLGDGQPASARVAAILAKMQPDTVMGSL